MPLGSEPAVGVVLDGACATPEVQVKELSESFKPMLERITKVTNQPGRQEMSPLRPSEL